MNVHKFNVPEMYSNSKGKTSASLVAAHILIATGCIMGLMGANNSGDGAMLQGIAFATLGSTLLGIRRITNDKEVSPEADPITITKTDTKITETKVE